MSKAAAAAAPAPAEGAAPNKKGKLIIILLVAIIVLLIAGGGAAFFLMSKKHAAEDEEGGEHPAKHAKADEKEHAKPDYKPKAGTPPVFVSLDPFTVNLAPDNGSEQYLQVVSVLKVAEAPIADQIKQVMPELRHRTLMLLSSKKAAEITSTEGREELAEAIRTDANDLLGYAPKLGRNGKPKPVEGPILAVLFTSFIVQ